MPVAMIQQTTGAAGAVAVVKRTMVGDYRAMPIIGVNFLTIFSVLSTSSPHRWNSNTVGFLKSNYFSAFNPRIFHTDAEKLFPSKIGVQVFARKADRYKSDFKSLNQSAGR